MNKYGPNDNYCDEARKKQSVGSADDLKKQYPSLSVDEINKKRAGTLYSCPDNYQMGSIQDNKIYIATTDVQHDQIAKGVYVDAHGGLSGYFSDQATIDACKTGNSLDNTKYNEMCQIAPYREYGINGTGDAYYKPHVDCFEIDREALYNNYHTYDFNAAISKCEANNHFGSGGGNQGYNPYINEMIDNGTLKHRPEKSYSDLSVSKSTNNNANGIKTNSSIVSEDKYEKMYADAQTRAQNCVQNNTPHPSEEACKNGYPKNTQPVESDTGHATPVNKEKESKPYDNNDGERGKKTDEPPKQEPDLTERGRKPAETPLNNANTANTTNIPPQTECGKKPSTEADTSKATNPTNTAPDTANNAAKGAQSSVSADKGFGV